MTDNTAKRILKDPKVSGIKHIPINAICLTWFIGCCLALIPLGPSAAFINIQTTGNSGLLTSYIICIPCRIHNRNTVGVTGNLPKPPAFSLGRHFGNFLNVIAILFLVVFLVSGMFPVAPKPTTDTMNWSSLALGLMLFIALVSYMRLRKTYLGPQIRGHSGSGELEGMDAEVVVSKGVDRRM